MSPLPPSPVPSPSGSVSSPLPAPGSASRRLFRLSGVDESRALLSTLYAVASVEPARAGVMSGELELTALGTLYVIKTAWGCGWKSVSPLVHSRYVVCLAHAGQARGIHGTTPYDVLPGVAGGIYSPGASVDFEAGDGYQGRTFTVGRTELEEQLTALTGRSVNGPLHFEPALDLRHEAGAAFREIARLFRSELERPAASPFVLNPLREAFLSALLTSFPHSASSLFEAQPARIAPRSVRRAEEYIAAHATDPLTLADIASVAEVSTRSLQMAFKAYRSTTPMQMLRDRRFELVRARLLASAPGTRVSEVVASVGVGGTTGRFSVEYGKRFGESPSQTLRRAHGRHQRGAA